MTKYMKEKKIIKNNKKYLIAIIDKLPSQLPNSIQVSNTTKLLPADRYGGKDEYSALLLTWEWTKTT